MVDIFLKFWEWWLQICLQYNTIILVCASQKSNQDLFLGFTLIKFKF